MHIFLAVQRLAVCCGDGCHAARSVPRGGQHYLSCISAVMEVVYHWLPVGGEMDERGEVDGREEQGVGGCAGLWSFASLFDTLLRKQVIKSYRHREYEAPYAWCWHLSLLLCRVWVVFVHVQGCLREWCSQTSRCVFYPPCCSTIPHHCQIIPVLMPIFPLFLDWTGRDNLGLERAVRPGALLIHFDVADLFNIHRSSDMDLNIFHYISS